MRRCLDAIDKRYKGAVCWGDVMEFDYVIIGGGSGGATLAGRLTQDSKTSVCLIEAGPDDSPFLRTPFVTALMVPGKLRNWAFNTVPQKGLNGRVGYQPRGKILGGSSGINAMIYIRGHASDYDDWAAMGAKGWSFADVLPYFKRSENNEVLGGELHGKGGPLNVTNLASPNALNDMFFDACDKLQLPRNPDFNGPTQDGMGLYQVTQKNGERHSASRAYLDEAARKRPNLRILLNAHALRVTLDGKRVTGAVVKHGEREELVTARRAVVMAAGAFQSPQLLLLSGIGPAQEIKAHGLEVRHQLDGVGRNLQDHLDFTLMYKAASPHLFGFTPRAIMRLPREIRRYRREGKGLMTSNFAESGGFLRTDPSLPRPDVQYHFVMGLVDDHARKRHLGTGYSLHTCVLRPKSRGTVGLFDANPMSPPRIDPNFLGAPGHPLDLRVLGTEQTLEARALAEWHAAANQSSAETMAARSEFDAALGAYDSRLLGYDADAEATMADAVRAVLGVPRATMPDDAALAQVLDPVQNPYLGHPLFLGMHSKLMQTMSHVQFTWAKRISMAEDAQNQRHRGTVGSRPALLAWQSREPDVILPWAIRQNPAAQAEYDTTIRALSEARATLLDRGAPPEAAMYLLPNAQRIRFVESGTLQDYYWKWVKRLCFDAQREIFETAVDEVSQVREVFPTIGRYVDGPPCVMRSRSGTAPVCPEGERYCGIPVWRNYAFEALESRRVM